MPEVEKHYTADSAAELLSVNPKTIRRAIWSGELKAKRFGQSIRIPAEDLTRYVRSRPAA